MNRLKNKQIAVALSNDPLPVLLTQFLSGALEQGSIASLHDLANKRGACFISDLELSLQACIEQSLAPHLNTVSLDGYTDVLNRVDKLFGCLDNLSFKYEVSPDYIWPSKSRIRFNRKKIILPLSNLENYLKECLNRVNTFCKQHIELDEEIDWRNSPELRGELAGATPGDFKRLFDQYLKDPTIDVFSKLIRDAHQKNDPDLYAKVLGKAMDVHVVLATLFRVEFLRIEVNKKVPMLSVVECCDESSLLVSSSPPSSPENRRDNGSPPHIYSPTGVWEVDGRPRPDSLDGWADQWRGKRQRGGSAQALQYGVGTGGK